MIYFDDFFIELLFFFGIANLCLYSFSIYNDFQKINQNENEKILKEEELKKKPLLSQVPYEQKYLQEYKKRLENTIINTNENTTEEKRILKNSFIIEKTPLGNVAMYYNEERECFEYYSDSTIPYRYLEAIGRKYVLTFDCLTIYINMDEELRKQKESWEQNKELEKQEKQEQQEKQERQKQNAKENPNQMKNEEETPSTKKNVFAKLKNYNKSSNPIQPTNPATRPNQDQEIKNPTNQKTQTIPWKKPNTIQYNTSNSSNSSVLLKEKSNSYLSKGRFSNFTILQPVKKEMVDKNYKMSFKDFKNLYI